MPAPTTPEEAIEQSALGPKSATVDGNSVTQHSMDDLIKAADRVRSNTAASADRPGMGVRVQQITRYYQ